MEIITNNRLKESRYTAANLHVIGACSMNCKMCFSKSLDKGYVTPSEWVPVLNYLKGIGVEKINFAGGEPVLYPFLKDLAGMAHHMGFYTSIISNGSHIDEKWLQEMSGIIDCIGLSIDSPDENDEIIIGRHVRGAHHLSNVKKILRTAKRYGYYTKVNIVVNGYSYQKNFRTFLEDTRPDRIKAFQVLRLEGTNDDMPDGLWVSEQQFDEFRRNHLDLGISFEDNEDMSGTYLMFDPHTNLMDNRYGRLDLVPFTEVVENGIENYVDLIDFGSRQEIYWRGPKIAVFGPSRSGKDYSIRDATKMLFSHGFEFSQISPIALVHNHLGERKLKNMTENDKKKLICDVRKEIEIISSSNYVFVDEHYCFPCEYGGKSIENGYSDEKLPFVLTIDENGRYFECVFDESWLKNYDLVLYMDIPSDIILDRIHRSEGCKNNPYATLQDIESWKAFELSELERLCKSSKIRMERITDPEKSGEQICEAVLRLLKVQDSSASTSNLEQLQEDLT